MPRATTGKAEPPDETYQLPDRLIAEDMFHPAGILGRSRRTDPELLLKETLQQPVPPVHLAGKPPAFYGQLDAAVMLVPHQPALF